MLPFVYLNGEIKHKDQACVSILDRGFLLGDAVYEVVPLYQGALFRFEDHIKRLERSLEAISIQYNTEIDSWLEAVNELISKNEAHQGDHAVYIQVTRGPASMRYHEFPQPAEPTALIMMWPVKSPVRSQQSQGYSAITVEDIRWSWCYIKATTLLPNLLMNQRAKDEGAYEAILIRDGEALEGATSNLFIVDQGVLITPPKGLHILGGITRDVILELAETYGLSYKLQPITEQQLHEAEEVWITSSTKEIYPITTLDNKPVGSGAPGAYWQRMLDLYSSYKQQYINEHKL